MARVWEIKVCFLSFEKDCIYTFFFFGSKTAEISIQVSISNLPEPNPFLLLVP